jgi:hypothetical protein
LSFASAVVKCQVFKHLILVESFGDNVNHLALGFWGSFDHRLEFWFRLRVPRGLLDLILCAVDLNWRRGKLLLFFFRLRLLN